MREKRNSFLPHPCPDCGTPVIGRALRCPPCKRTDVLRRQREFHAGHRAHYAAAVKRRFAQHPEKRKAADARKRANIAKDPERVARYAENARRRSREWSAAKRAQNEAAILENLIGPNK